jgi:hypothetical protein
MLTDLLNQFAIFALSTIEKVSTSGIWGVFQGFGSHFFAGTTVPYHATVFFGELGEGNFRDRANWDFRQLAVDGIPRLVSRKSAMRRRGWEVSPSVR